MTEGGRLLSVEPPAAAVAVVTPRSYTLDAREGAGESSVNGVDGGDMVAASARSSAARFAKCSCGMGLGGSTGEGGWCCC